MRIYLAHNPSRSRSHSPSPSALALALAPIGAARAQAPLIAPRSRPSTCARSFGRSRPCRRSATATALRPKPTSSTSGRSRARYAGYSKSRAGVSGATLSRPTTSITLGVAITSCQVLGACMYAAIFSNVAQLIAKLDAAGSRYSEELDRLTEFSTFYR